MPRGPPAAPSSSGNDPPPSLKKGTSVSAHMGATRVVMCREFGHPTPHLRDIRPIINAINNYQQVSINKCVNFSLDEFVKNHKLQNHHCIYGPVRMRPKKFRKTPSARRIFPKVFRRSHFWTYLSCPFLKTFSTLVQIRIEKITKKLQDLGPCL